MTEQKVVLNSIHSVRKMEGDGCRLSERAAKIDELYADLEHDDELVEEVETEHDNVETNVL